MCCFVSAIAWLAGEAEEMYARTFGSAQNALLSLTSRWMGGCGRVPSCRLVTVDDSEQVPRQAEERRHGGWLIL